MTLFYLLIITYSLFMIYIAFYLRKKLSGNLVFLTILSSVILLCTPLHPLFLYGGIILLHISGILNDYYMSGKMDYQHLLIRGIFSLGVLFLYFFIR